MMYHALSHADALKMLNILGIDLSVTAVNDPLSNSNGQLLSETGIAVVVIVSPTTRREQIRLLYKALVLHDSFLFIYYRGEPLSLCGKRY
jgi:tryptophan synthase alpha subunit